ncbi:MAG TPA: paraquat-inducible protein A [Spirochaetota bacterium]|nr:paraquat-inducible protein A [Spirochaetota bacterium]
MKHFNLIISATIVGISAILCFQFILHSISNQNYKNDHAELNHVKFGLFNAGEWKKQINEIIAEEINRFYLSRTNERELKKKIEILLNTLIDEVDSKIRKANAGSAEGWIRQSFINTFISLDDIKKGIPQYADAIIHEMTRTKTRAHLKALLNKQLEKYFRQTFDVQDNSQLDRILLETNSTDIQSARVRLKEVISDTQSRIVIESTLLIILPVILFALSGLSKRPLLPSRYIFLVLSLILLLTAGVTTPMIDMEAKISQISFVLMGHPIQFTDQVLYFQSKSILDVFWIMITHADFQMKFVGILMVIFSVVFPLLKIISTFVYYFNYHQGRENPIVRFFILKSGKWSMADVMVIAIFMAYIGFNGIITSQFGQLSSKSQDLVILTTNGTSLQPGYYLFLTYTILALFLSGFLTREALADIEWPRRPSAYSISLFDKASN